MAQGDKRLVAYFAPAEGPSIQELRTALQGVLPEYMVPSAFVGLPSLPLTPNGKVDRKALPVPDDNAATGPNTSPPSTPVEEVLVGIWMEVLGVIASASTTTSSSSAATPCSRTQVASRIRKDLGVDLPLRALFESPTVAALAEEVQARLSGGHEAESHIVRAPRDAPLPLSFAERRMWFLDQFEPGTSTYNMPEALRLRGQLDEGALEQALVALVQRHEGLRTRFAPKEGEPRRVVDAETHFVLERHSLEASDAVDRQRRVFDS